MNSSKRTRLPWPHQRKEDDVADRRAVREQHHQAVDSHTFACRWRHAVLQSANVVFVHFMRFLIAAGSATELIFEPPTLLSRVIQLAERIRDLEATDVQLKSFDGLG